MIERFVDYPNASTFHVHVALRLEPVRYGLHRAQADIGELVDSLVLPGFRSDRGVPFLRGQWKSLTSARSELATLDVVGMGACGIGCTPAAGRLG